MSVLNIYSGGGYRRRAVAQQNAVSVSTGVTLTRSCRRTMKESIPKNSRQRRPQTPAVRPTSSSGTHYCYRS